MFKIPLSFSCAHVVWKGTMDNRSSDFFNPNNITLETVYHHHQFVRELHPVPCRDDEALGRLMSLPIVTTSNTAADPNATTFLPVHQLTPWWRLPAYISSSPTETSQGFSTFKGLASRCRRLLPVHNLGDDIPPPYHDSPSAFSTRDMVKPCNHIPNPAIFLLRLESMLLNISWGAPYC